MDLGLSKNRKILLIVGIVALFSLLAVVTAISCGFFSSSTGQDPHSPVTRAPPSIIIGGSTTIQPVSELLAKAYMANHPGVTITVQPGGSGVGITNAASGKFDIGASSRNLEPGERQNYPDLVTHQIGGSGIVIIVHKDYPADTISFEELRALYNNAGEDIHGQPAIHGINRVVQRSELSSGTEEVFAQWLFGSQVKNLKDSLNASDTGDNGPVVHVTAEGNTGVLQAVKENQNSLGFVDFGYAETDTGVKMLRVLDQTAQGALPESISSVRGSILSQLSYHDGANHQYIDKLTRPLIYLTNGTSSDAVKDFIRFSQSDAAKKYFHEVGYFSVADISNSTT